VAFFAGFFVMGLLILAVLGHPYPRTARTSAKVTISVIGSRGLGSKPSLT
jgi:hypothetical protein